MNNGKEENWLHLWEKSEQLFGNLVNKESKMESTL